jgi:hypothetical protein
MFKNEKDYLYPKPPDPDRAILWRYLSTDPAFDPINKFVDLFENGRLWLTKASGLPDEFEGRRTQADRLAWVKNGFDLEKLDQIEELMSQSVCVNSWHLGSVESPFMWREYCGIREGVVVRTTFSKLELECKKTGEEIFTLGLIRYIDHSKDRMPPWNASYPYMHKDIKFKPDCEARINMRGDPAAYHGKPPYHAEMKVALLDLIDEIIVHPMSTQSYFDYVKEQVGVYTPSLLQTVRWSNLRGNISEGDFQTPSR